MKERGVPPDLISYNSAIDACGKGGRWERNVAVDALHVPAAQVHVFFFLAFVLAVRVALVQLLSCVLSLALLQKVLTNLGVYSTAVHARTWELGS